MTSPTRTTQFPTTLQPDAPMVLDASWRFDRSDRAYIDGQILGIQGVIKGGSFSGNATSIDGVALDSSMLAPPASGFMQQVGGKWAAVSAAVAAGVLSASLSVAGDVSGPLASTTVNKINGTSVPASPTATYVLQATSNTTATWVNPSTFGVAPGTAGQIFITNNALATTWTSLITVNPTTGSFAANRQSAAGVFGDSITAQYTGSIVATMGVYNSTVGNGVLYLGANAALATANNYTLYADSANTFLNAGTTVDFCIGNVSYMTLQATALALNSGVISVDWTTATTPFIQSGTAATSLTLGTNKAAAVLTLQADAAASVMQLAGGTQNGVALGASVAAIGHWRTPSGLNWLQRNGANTGNITVFSDDGANNYQFANGASSTTINGGNYVVVASTGGYIELAGTDVYLDANTQHMRNSAHVEYITVSPAVASIFAFDETVTTSATITYIGRTSDAATHNLTIQGQYAFATATLTNRTPGSIVFDIGAPQNGGTTEGVFKFTRNGAQYAQIATGSGVTTYAHLWLGTAAASNTNWSLRSDGSGSCYLNSEASTAVGLVTGGSTFQLYISGQIANFGSSGAASPVNIDWTTSTTPVIHSGTAATSLTVGTAKAGASLTLQSDASLSHVMFDHPSTNVMRQSLYDHTGTSQMTLAVNDSTDFVTWTLAGSAWEFSWVVGSGAMNLSSNFYAVGGGSAWWISASTTTVYFGGAVTATAPVIIDFTTSTTPTILSGSLATSLSVGTNKSGASAVFKGDAATTILTLTTFGDFATAVKYDNVAAPATPSGGGMLFSSSGAGKWIGTSGTITTFGPADLDGFKDTAGDGHCPVCGTDFAHEWHNKKYGSLTICMRCLAEEVGEREWIVRKAA